MDDEQQMYHQSGKLVRFLDSWKSSGENLFERISQLTSAMAKASYWNALEVDIIQAWLDALQYIQYKPPSLVKEKKSHTQQLRRTAVCATGLMECLDEGWTATFPELKKRLAGDMDVFMFLSSTSKSSHEMQQALRQQATVQVFYEDRNLDPKFMQTCSSDFKLRSDLTINSFLQQIWAILKCHDLVIEYLKKMNVEYQLLVRARADH
ncbi:unnamed protein product, partial [Didymodactylos carnosus]